MLKCWAMAMPFLYLWPCDSCEMRGFIALEISAYLGHVGMVDLLAAQPGPLMQTQRSTLLANALRNAAQNGHLAVMRLLKTLGALQYLSLAVG